MKGYTYWKIHSGSKVPPLPLPVSHSPSTDNINEDKTDRNKDSVIV